MFSHYILVTVLFVLCFIELGSCKPNYIVQPRERTSTTSEEDIIVFPESDRVGAHTGEKRVDIIPETHLSEDEDAENHQNDDTTLVKEAAIKTQISEEKTFAPDVPETSTIVTDVVDVTTTISDMSETTTTMFRKLIGAPQCGAGETLVHGHCRVVVGS